MKQHEVCFTSEHSRRLVQEHEPAADDEEILLLLLDEVRSWSAQDERVLEVPSEHERRARKAQLLISEGKVYLQHTALNGRPERQAINHERSHALFCSCKTFLFALIAFATASIP